MSEPDIPSGLRLPPDAPLPLEEVAPGLWLVRGCYEVDHGYFGLNPLYVSGREPGGEGDGA